MDGRGYKWPGKYWCVVLKNKIPGFARVITCTMAMFLNGGGQLNWEI